MRTKRLVIYPKDIQVITGRSERYGRNIIQRIKDSRSKEAHQLVTITEFADYMGLDEKEIRSCLL